MSSLDELKNLLFTDHVSEDTVSRAERLKQPHIPRRLFKYRSFDEKDRNIAALESDTIWCSSPFNFNDPYDCSLHFGFKKLANIIRRALENVNHIFSSAPKHQLLPEEIDEICNSDDILKSIAEVVDKKGIGILAAATFRSQLEDVIHEKRDGLEKALRGSLQVASLCERYDSMLMWSHYAEDHKGFAVEYDVSRDQSLSKILWPVFYQKEVFDISETIFGEHSEKYNEAYMIGAASVKSDDWEYEREWRLVRLRQTNGDGSNISTPKPTAIYLGAFISDQNKEKIVKIASTREIPVFRMQRERGRFRMEAREMVSTLGS
ncbi:DUF2971 domain-containing protein [Pseudomonas aeruginosa]|uniref:DUF2971 domain-containing protein n=1 Tax=Pseudomonas aeruginosa TaxID=287 RepID=UPI0018C27E9A|nr:DUF2971 domain-containing protein [Pseudomonas aeruginosa]QPP28316.1 DUF2971 domain-containing protein [Pseudomonas aeruginosa]